MKGKPNGLTLKNRVEKKRSEGRKEKPLLGRRVGVKKCIGGRGGLQKLSRWMREKNQGRMTHTFYHRRHHQQ